VSFHAFLCAVLAIAAILAIIDAVGSRIKMQLYRAFYEGDPPPDGGISETEMSRLRDEMLKRIAEEDASSLFNRRWRR
jgi:hypothetical protein